MPRIAIIPGDGIGVDVTREASRVLRRIADLHDLDIELSDWDLGAERYLRDGVTITEEEFRSLAEDHDAILLGALGDPRVPGNEHARDILLGLRFRLDLYVNFRPSYMLDPALSPLKGAEGREIRLDIFRENTEGPYVNLGGTFKRDTPDEIAIQEDVNTRKGVERILRAAFDHAVARGLSRVSMVDKANALPHAGGLWRRTLAEVARDYPGVETESLYVDAVAMDLVRRPERYGVIVTSNLFGDILSDLAAAIVGGLGMASSANLHPGRHALYEPVHGSAPDIAGKGIANPLGAIGCVALFLEHQGHSDAARAVESAVAASVAGGVKTPDLGGTASTSEVGDWIVEHLEGSSPRGPVERR